MVDRLAHPPLQAHHQVAAGQRAPEDTFHQGRLAPVGGGRPPRCLRQRQARTHYRAAAHPPARAPDPPHDIRSPAGLAIPIHRIKQERY